MTTPILAGTHATSAALPRKRDSEAHRRLAFVDHVTLFLIGLVVVLVSLPRLRSFALRENELDALRMLRALGDDALEHPEALSTGDLGALLAANARHQVRLEDVELLGAGRLRRHGYVFDSTRDASGRWVLRAWPWTYGRTGLGAFAIVPGEDLVGTANVGGAFSGPDRPPAPPAESAEAGWRSVPGT